MQEILVRFLGWEDPLEKGKATHSRIMACRIPRGSQRVGHDWATFTLETWCLAHAPSTFWFPFLLADLHISYILMISWVLVLSVHGLTTLASPGLECRRSGQLQVCWFSVCSLRSTLKFEKHWNLKRFPERFPLSFCLGSWWLHSLYLWQFGFAVHY